MKPRAAISNIKDYLPGKNPFKPGMIKLASNENPFGPSPKALKAIAKEVKRLQVYPDQKATALREALAKKFKLVAENFICGNGSDEIMQLLASVYLNPGDEVLIAEHSFSVYELVARLFDAKPVFVPLRDYALDFGALAGAITEKTKIIFLTNPNNPTGKYFSAAELEEFLNGVPERIIVVIDEAYAEFAAAKDFPRTIEQVKKRKNVVALRTFSKFYGLAGLRIGYGIGPAELLAPLFRAKMPFNVNRLAQAGATAALSDPAFLKKTARNNLAGRKYLYAQFDKLGLSYLKTEANFIFVNIKRSADQFAAELQKKGIIVRPLTSFGFPEAVRISIGTMKQNERLIKTLSC